MASQFPFFALESPAFDLTNLDLFGALRALRANRKERIDCGSQVLDFLEKFKVIRFLMSWCLIRSLIKFLGLQNFGGFRFVQLQSKGKQSKYQQECGTMCCDTQGRLVYGSSPQRTEVLPYWRLPWPFRKHPVARPNNTMQNHGPELE